MVIYYYYFALLSAYHLLIYDNRYSSNRNGFQQDICEYVAHNQIVLEQQLV